jgi:UDP-N-acetyl-D-glucosamine dehydrogenase
MKLAPPAAELLLAIEEHRAGVGVIGLGYVGLPLAIALAGKGFSVLGFDVDRAKIDSIAAGKSFIRHVGSEGLAKAVEAGRLAATDDFDRLGEPDVLLICVPTPLTEDREPDLSYVLSTARQIAPRLRRGQLVVLESTTYPGTTEGELREVLDESGLVLGEDYYLAYSPERENPGSARFSTSQIPRVVGGVDEASGRLADAFYRQLAPSTIRVSSARTAEATKLVENIFRAVNIALVNELKMVYDRMGIDIWEVLDAAETKPFGFMRFDPGPGWGGHCIPIDPFYLTWKARQHGVTPRFIELAGEVNVEMPRYVVRKLEEALEAKSQSLDGSRILLLGLAYKKDVADPRESPAFEILELLLRAGAEVSYHDPYIPEAPTMRSWPDLPALRSQPLTAETLRNVDAAVIVTDHSDVDYELVAREAPVVVDSRGVYRRSSAVVIQA